VNEDAAALIPVDAERAVLAVADGVGGAPGGAQASALALRALQAALRAVTRELRDSILDGIERANRAVIGLGAGAATTLALAEVGPRTVRPYHVGDSGVLLVGGRGRLKLRTVSHSPVGYAVEAGVLDPGEAMRHQDRHLISNMVGRADMRIEVGPVVPLSPRDTLLLATDGLLDNLEGGEVVALLGAGPLDAAADCLFAACRQRMAEPERGRPSKPDDLTFLAFRAASAARSSRRARRGSAGA
jgi:serine/threonine protein phosphatase PrpC